MDANVIAFDSYIFCKFIIIMNFILVLFSLTCQFYNSIVGRVTRMSTVLSPDHLEVADPPLLPLIHTLARFLHVEEGLSMTTIVTLT